MQALAEKYFRRALLPGEERELARLVAMLDDEEIGTLLQQAWEAQQIEGQTVFNQSETEAMFKQIMGKEDSRGRIRPLYRRAWFRLAAAALVLIAFAGLYLLLNRPPAPATAALEPVRHELDVDPGGDKAILTLADGSAIILDSAPSGVITQQGAAQIRKLDNGQLAYMVKGKTAEILYNTISTPRGGQYKLTLADGSRVWLNAASSIRFPAAFSEKTRDVSITGEAYFEVAKNPAKPFRINVANRCQVEVVGTAFNVNAYPEETSLNTTLVEGRVKISAPDGQTAILTPRQQAQLSERLHIVDGVDTEAAAAWVTGWFMFNRTDLQSIMRQISRWYDIDVRFEGNVPNRSFSGIVSRDNKVSEVLKIMEQAGVRFRIEPEEIVVIR